MQSVAVVIAAKDAGATIREAVASALAQPEVSSVIVIDDGSIDNTSAIALHEGAGTSRVRIIRLDLNMGPARARNIGVANATEPFIAILDADDCFMPGRIGRLMAKASNDVLADNIAFVRNRSGIVFEAISEEVLNIGSFKEEWTDLNLESFVKSNISHYNAPRAELGFLKPIIRREILINNPYNPDLKLGEDYALYAQILADGAKFCVCSSVGYIALVRNESLSSSHSTEDLRSFSLVSDRILCKSGLSKNERTALSAHAMQTKGRYEHRRFLDDKKRLGAVDSAFNLLKNPKAWVPVAKGVLSDKFLQLHSKKKLGDITFLLR